MRTSGERQIPRRVVAVGTSLAGVAVVASIVLVTVLGAELTRAVRALPVGTPVVLVASALAAAAGLLLLAYLCLSYAVGAPRPGGPVRTVLAVVGTGLAVPPLVLVLAGLPDGPEAGCDRDVWGCHLRESAPDAVWWALAAWALTLLAGSLLLRRSRSRRRSGGGSRTSR